MTIEHKDIPEAELHEPKGASTALSSQVLTSDGAGNTLWTEQQTGITAIGALAESVFVADGLNSGGWVVPAGALFGSVYFTGNAVATPIAASGTDVIIDPGTWAATVTNTISFVTSHFVIPTAGIYEISQSVSFSGGGGGSGNVYKYGFAANGTAIVTSPRMRSQTGSADMGLVALSTIQSFNIGDEISVIVQNETAANDPTISEASFTIVLLKAE